jgi:hypothetical protein
MEMLTLNCVRSYVENGVFMINFDKLTASSDKSHNKQQNRMCVSLVWKESDLICQIAVFRVCRHLFNLFLIMSTLRFHDNRRMNTSTDVSKFKIVQIYVKC